MKKRTKNLIIAFILLALVLVVFFIVSPLNENDNKKEDKASSDTSVLTEVAEGVSLTNISYTNEHGKFSFSLTDGEWIYDDDPDFPLSDAQLTDMVNRVSDIRVTRDITDEGGNADDYGLDDSSMTLTLGYSDESEKNFIIGNSCIGGYYLKHNDRIYVALSGVAAACSNDIYDMVDLSSVFKPSADNMISVTVDANVYTEKAMIEAICYEAQFINADTVVDHKNAESYGFDGSEHSVTYTYTSTTYTEDNNEPVEKQNEYTLRFAVKNGNEYLMLPNDPFIYLSNGASDLLDVKPDEAGAGPHRISPVS